MSENSVNVAENIAKLAAATRIGGKGTVRRKVKRVNTRPAYDEKRLAAQLQKLGISSVPTIEEATLLSKEGELYTFKNAKVHASVQANTCVISGTVEMTKAAKPAEDKVEEIDADEDDKPKIEEVNEDSDDDVPELAEAEEGGAHKQTKNEKKVRKSLTGLGMKPTTGTDFSEMRIRNGKNIMLVIKRPDVIKMSSPRGPAAYAVFGKVEVEDANAHNAQAQQLMEQIRQMQDKKGPAAEGDEDDSDDDCPDLAEVNFEEEAADAGDLNEDDLELVMKQSGVSKAKAIKALKENGGDVVNAIMALSE